MAEEINKTEQTINPESNNQIVIPEPATEVKVEAETPVSSGNTTESKPVAEISTPVEPVEAKTEEDAKKEAEKAALQAERKKRLDKVFDELKKIKEENGTINVEVISRIKGGLRVIYDNIQLFLPASHFTVKRTASEEELQEAIGNKYDVKVIEVQEQEDGRRAVIVSCKELLLNALWDKFSVGQKVTGKVSSIASFGVFVDLGGIEGLIHISRLSHTHIDNPSTMFKVGDEVECVIVEINKEKSRIALSRKELEKSPWSDVETEYPQGSIQKGIIRRVVDFGAYVELKQGVDGLLRNAEISWTKRISDASKVFTVGQEIEVYIIAANAEKHTISMSCKRLTPNPWTELVNKYPVGTVLKGTVAQILSQGVICSTEVIDGFMPKSKIVNLERGRKIPFTEGQEIELKIADIVPDQESVIFEPADQDIVPKEVRAPRPERFSRNNYGGGKDMSTESPISFLDMLSEDARKDLLGK